MKITLITPSSQNVSAFGARSLSSYLKAQGHDVQLVTLPIVPEVYRDARGCLFAKEYAYSERIVKQVLDVARRSDLVGISFMTQFYSCAVQLTRALRGSLQVPVVWGGVHPTVRPAQSLEHADVVCIGEGEGAMAELARRIESGRDYSDVANLCVRRNGRVIQNAVRPLIADIDALPFLDYGPENHFVRDPISDSIVAFDDQQFERSLARVPYFRNTLLRSFMYFTTRGCPYSCTYCVNDFLRRLYGTHGFIRKLSVERVIDELSSIIRQHPCIEEIEFCDDNFALRPVDEIERFARLYKERIGLPFQLLISPLNIVESKIGPLVDAGLVFVETGIQSAAEVSEDLYHRKANEEQLLQAAAILNSHRDRMAPPCYHLILDNPFERAEDTLKTFDLTLKLPRPFWFKRSSLVPFPGTAVFDQFQRAGLIKDEEQDVYRKVLEMPSTSYLNFLFLLCNQNYPAPLLRFLARRRLVDFFNRPAWHPVFDKAERVIRTGSRLKRWGKVALRGDWASIRERYAMARRSAGAVPTSRPPAF